jgi:hypothetical protein
MKFLEEHHIVRGWLPANINGSGATSDIVSLKNYNHVTIILDFAATDAAADVDIVVQACSDVAAAHTAAIASLTFRKSAATTSDDSFSDPVTVTDSKLDYVAAGDIVPDTDDNKIVVIDIDGPQVRGADDDYEYDCLRVVFPNPGQACTVGCLFILSEPRYAAATMPSAIID